MNRKINHQSGFTLIELMLAMTFISLLLMAIAFTTIRMSNIYSKGVTLKSVNEAGRSLGATLQRDVAGSVMFDVKPSLDPSSRYVVTPYGGRLCMGEISYVWNYGAAITEGENTIVYDDAQMTPVRLARVIDRSAQVCTDRTAKIDPLTATELLVSSDKLDLALHTFEITTSPAATDSLTGQALYSVSFTIGTNDQAALSWDDSVTCAAPNAADRDSNWEFCAVNVFNIVARAGNKGE